MISMYGHCVRGYGRLVNLRVPALQGRFDALFPVRVRQTHMKAHLDGRRDQIVVYPSREQSDDRKYLSASVQRVGKLFTARFAGEAIFSRNK